MAAKPKILFLEGASCRLLDKGNLPAVHFIMNLSFSPAIVTSNSPGSTTGLLFAPMNERSSGPSLDFQNSPCYLASAKTK